MSSVSDALVVAPTKQPKTAAEPLETRGMAVGQSLATALEALNANKLRSLLTMLGIIIGVGAVIIMISIGRGASANVAQRLQGLGTNMLNISPSGARGPGNVSAGAGSAPTLNEADAKAIQANIDGLDGVSPSNDISVQAVGNTSNWSTRATAVYPVYQNIENWQAQAGDLLSDQDQQQASTVAVIGQVVLDNLFGNGNSLSGDPASAVGQTIRLNKVPFRIVGVLAAKSDNEDNVILVPFSTGKRLKSQTFVNDIVVQVSDAKQMDSVQAQISDLLRERHRLINAKQDDFRIRNL